MPHSTRRALVLPVAIAVVAAGAVVLLWQALRADHVARVANVTEATSYATRSELARRLILQFQSLQTLAELWISAIADADDPDVEAPLRAIRFEGVDVVAFSGDDGSRFLATGADAVSGYVPTEPQWSTVAAFVAEAGSVAAATTRGPFVDEDGHAIFRYYLPLRRDGHHGVLAAIIDAHDLLAALLVDEALGYELRVSCCDGTELYQRGAADEGLPEAWTRDGWIAPAPGIRWNVRHRPSAELRQDLDTSAVDSVLVVGLALAALLGMLVFETRRANERAAAASTAERRIHHLHRELEERVVARTQKLNNVLRDLNTINLSVSHDLRSPLNAISLTVGQLAANNRDESTGGRLAKIAANVGRMKDMLDRLLGYARTASFESERENVDMQGLAEQVVREQGLDARTVTVGPLPPANVDRVIVHILLGNLVANAVKHGRSGRGLHIEIGASTIDGVTRYFVRDNGLGLDAGLAARLFKPLPERQQRALNDGGGLGLGLAIAARAVERHGGHIVVESEAGRGTTFRFTLQPEPSRSAVDETAASGGIASGNERQQP